MKPPAFVEKIDLPGFPPTSRGKVGDSIMLPPKNGVDRMLAVRTDRFSAFNKKLTPGIAGRGIILNQMSAYWFQRLASVLPELGHQCITSNVNEFDDELRVYADILKHRSMIVEVVEPLPVELIVRDVITGTGYKDYLKNKGKLCGIQLPAGMKEFQRIPGGRIFTPSMKSDTDPNISFDEACEVVNAEFPGRGKEIMDFASANSLALFDMGAKVAEEHQMDLLDTKFEMGVRPSTGKVILIDEVLTPDSSRYSPKSDQEGSRRTSMDKQIVRDWLVRDMRWDPESDTPPPNLSDEIVALAFGRYVELFQVMTGQNFEELMAA